MAGHCAHEPNMHQMGRNRAEALSCLAISCFVFVYTARGAAQQLHEDPLDFENIIVGEWQLDLTFTGQSQRPKIAGVLTCEHGRTATVIACKSRPESGEGAKWGDLLARSLEFTQIGSTRRYRVSYQERRHSAATFDPKQRVFDVRIPMSDDTVAIDRFGVLFLSHDSGEFLLQQIYKGKEVNAFVGAMVRVGPAAGIAPSGTTVSSPARDDSKATTSGPEPRRLAACDAIGI